MSDTEERRHRHFHEELDRLQERLLEMTGMAEDLFSRAIVAFRDRDPVAAGEIREADEEIDALEIEIDDRGMQLLALQQPMARDLRLILTVLKISNDIERVGDHAVNIAHGASRLAEIPSMPRVRELEEMAVISREMLSDALGSFVNRNPDAAVRVCETDDRVDDLHRSLHRILVTHMLEDPERITSALEHLLVSHDIERVADLATNIAEDTVFAVEGRTIKHHVADEGGPGGAGE